MITNFNTKKLYFKILTDFTISSFKSSCFIIEKNTGYFYIKSEKCDWDICENHSRKHLQIASQSTLKH